MRNLIYPFFVFLLVAVASNLQAQDLLGEHFQTEIHFRKTGMLVLGSWATANIAGGLVLRANTVGRQRYFHEMNAIWNTVNLGIATFGYISAARMGVPESAFGLYQEQESLDKTLLFNAGLDLAYIAGGFWMMERAKNTDNKPERLEGYGKSVVLQGAFLFVFDLAMIGFHQKLKIPENLGLSLRPGSPDFLCFSYAW